MAAKLCYSPSEISNIRDGLTEEKTADFIDMLANNPLMYRQLLVRYLIAFCVLLALLLTLAFYIRRGRHLHVSPQADMPEWVAGEYEKYSPEGEQI